jgi:PAS domain S-box-containing protein
VAALDERMFKTLFEQSAAAMLVIDDERRYVAANEAAGLLLKYGAGALIGLRVDDLTPEERRSGLERRWEVFLERGEASGRVPLVRADGSRIEVDHSTTANVSAGIHFAVLSAQRNGAAEAGKDRVLTTREREVLTALAGGQTGGDIARQLFIAPDTVRRHVANAREKLGARTRVHAIAEALRRGEIWP